MRISNFQLTPEQEAQLREARKLEDLDAQHGAERGRQMDRAATEPTLSGAVRRSVHRSDVHLHVLAERAGLELDELDRFLAGEQSIPSAALDMLAAAVGVVASVPVPLYYAERVLQEEVAAARAAVR